MNKQKRIELIAAEIATEYGLEVVEVSLKGQGRRQFLRITIDKPGSSIGLDDCENVSRQLSVSLDVEDFMEGSYTLEVTSPGLDRPLKKREDFVKNIGKLVKVVTRQKVNNTNSITGRLADTFEEGIIVDDNDNRYEINYQNISRARLEIEIK
ncbi:MAG: ribosome maturation factor RimP [Candidatus Magnetoovum sp. WYHC-5]|nr:ribosome maturation factor RimP [Candidatus Magnetoovum sp. WYHC-5]